MKKTLKTIILHVWIIKPWDIKDIPVTTTVVNRIA